MKVGISTEPKILTAAQKQMANLRTNMTVSLLTGQHKQYVARKEYAKLFVNNPQDAISMGTKKYTIPWKYTFNALGIMFKELFRPKNENEKLMFKIAKEIRAKQALENQPQNMNRNKYQKWY